MANMKMLIRIVFVIFIANRIDCLGGVCDNWCNCFKEGIKEDENNTAKSLVNTGWYNAKKENLVLKIFKKEDDNDNIFTSKDNKYKISIEFDENNNPKIVYQNETENEPKLEDKLKLKDQKYALFEIKTQEREDTVYLYCSDVESSWNFEGIFSYKDHKSISVIACDTLNVTDMTNMFNRCSNLTKLDLLNFNTKNVTDMKFMFSKCSNLKELDLKNFDTSNVTNMSTMFSGCSRLTKLDLLNFNTKNITSMFGMFYGCSSLTELDLKNFDTKNVTIMVGMFSGCSSLENLDISNFNTSNVPDRKNRWHMFYKCDKLSKDKINKILNEK